MIRLAALAALFAACSLPADSFLCENSGQCIDGELRGRCEPEGVCSFPDPACETGHRFGEASGDRAGRCTSTHASGADAGSSPVAASDAGQTQASVAIVSPGHDSRWAEKPDVSVLLSGTGVHRIDLFAGTTSAELVPVGGVTGDSGTVQFEPATAGARALVLRAVGYTRTGDEVLDQVEIDYRFGAEDAPGDGLAGVIADFAPDKSRYLVGEPIVFSGTLDGSVTTADSLVLLSQGADGVLAWVLPNGAIAHPVTGTSFEVPPEEARFSLAAAPPGGDHRVRIFYVAGAVNALPAIDDLVGPRAVERATRRLLAGRDRWDYADTAFSIQ